ncbi:Homeobox domain containing protein [Amanita muscaria]
MAQPEISLSPIIHDAQRIIDCISRTLKISPSQSPAHLLQNLKSPPATHVIRKPNLPSVETYLAVIRHRDLPTGIVECCHGALHDLAQRTHETFDRTIREAASLSPPGTELTGTIDAFCRVLEKQYHHQSVQIMQRVDVYLTKKLACEEHVPVAKSPKPTFNHKYTPLLEQYFESNAYPSGSDKASLAKRTGMTQRQIDVWFQNHRTRAKRDGRPLRRSLDGGMSTPLAANILNTNNAISPQQVYSPVASSDTEIGESDSDSQVFASDNKERCHTILDKPSSQTPPYAFPALYRQRDKQDPIIIPPVNWERNLSARKGSHHPIDMDELISSFASKLTLGARDSNVPRRKKFEQGFNGCQKVSWFESRRTVPAAAPLTALVRSQKPKSEILERHRLAAQRRPHPYGARWTPISEPCRRPRPGARNNQRRRSSSTSTSSYSSSGSSEDTSSGNELFTPPASPMVPPQFFAEKTIPFDVFGWGSDSP